MTRRILFKHWWKQVFVVISFLFFFCFIFILYQSFLPVGSHWLNVILITWNALLSLRGKLSLISSFFIYLLTFFSQHERVWSLTTSGPLSHLVRSLSSSLKTCSLWFSRHLRLWVCPGGLGPEESASGAVSPFDVLAQKNTFLLICNCITYSVITLVSLLGCTSVFNECQSASLCRGIKQHLLKKKKNLIAERRTIDPSLWRRLHSDLIRQCNKTLRGRAVPAVSPD